MQADITGANVTLPYRRSRNGYLYLQVRHTQTAHLYNLHFAMYNIQIRANNIYRSGNWSEPYVIPVTTDNYPIDCATSGNEMSDTRSIGIIAGSLVGGLTLAIVVGCSLCLILCCVRHIRERKSLIRITQVHTNVSSASIIAHTHTRAHAHTHACTHTHIHTSSDVCDME